MATSLASIWRTYRGLMYDPVSVYRQIGTEGGLKFQRFGASTVATVTDPAILRHVLVSNAGNYRKTQIARALLEPILGRGLLTSEGSFWRRQRRIAAPAFHHKRIAAFADMIVAQTRDMLKGWEAAAAERCLLDMQSEMSQVTMKVITKAMFSDEIGDAEARGISEAIRVLSRHRLRLRDLIGLPEWLPRLTDRRIASALKTVDHTVARLIGERRADDQDYGDLLSMLMQTEDDETGERMSDQQLRDEVITMFIAGHETTATALVWTIYALDRHRDAEAKMHAELDATLANGSPSLEDIERLPYTRHVIEETMRLYPTVAQVAREAINEDTIEGTRVPQGAVINMNIWLAHRDPAVWTEPERFDPDRFDPERAGNRPKLAYFPFGGGPRICIGNSFAMLEAHLILATIARDWRLRLPKGHKPHPIGNVVLRPRDGLPVHVERRHDKQGRF